MDKKTVPEASAQLNSLSAMLKRAAVAAFGPNGRSTNQSLSNYYDARRLLDHPTIYSTEYLKPGNRWRGGSPKELKKWAARVPDDWFIDVDVEGYLEAYKTTSRQATEEELEAAKKVIADFQGTQKYVDDTLKVLDK